jgi:large subunit ribosomal protein L3
MLRASTVVLRATNETMKFILGEKVAMTQFFDAKGRASGATIVKTGPVVVTQVKTVATDGYNAVQVGFGERNAKNIAKAQQGHFKKLGNFRYTREFRVNEAELANYTVGQTIDASAFASDDVVRVTGTSKGKGFQGGVKRHGFAGGPRSHGQKHSEREPGSIGGSGGRAGGRVAKGMRMAGRMGSDLITVKNLKVLAVDKATNTLVVKGAVPGKPGTLLEIIG